MKKSTVHFGVQGQLSGLALALVLSLGCAEELEPVESIRPVKTIVLGGASVSGGRAFPGTVRAAQRAQLSFRVSGPLVKLPITEGMQARKGQLLAQIDPRDFETTVRNLEAQLANLNSQLAAMRVARPEDIRRLEAELGAAKARLLEGDANFRRYQRLYENDNVSKAEFDQRRAARDVAEADVSSAQQALEIGRRGARVEDIQAMEARIRAMDAQIKQAEDNLRDTSLVAPYGGVVAARLVDNFEYVRAQEPVVSFQNMETVELVAQIPESIVAQARKGDVREYLVRFPTLAGRQFQTKPTEFSTEADPITRTYDVTFQFPQPADANIFGGMTGEIVIADLAQDEVGFTVPVSAVFTDENGKESVWLFSDSSMTVKKAAVEVGDLVADSITLMAGVNPGDKIVTAGASHLYEGQQVREVVDELRERK